MAASAAPLSKLLTGSFEGQGPATINSTKRTVSIGRERFFFDDPALLPLVVKVLQGRGVQFAMEEGRGGGGLVAFLQQVVVVSLPLVFMHNMIKKMDPNKGEEDGHNVRVLHKEGWSRGGRHGGRAGGGAGGRTFEEMMEAYPRESMLSIRQLVEYVQAPGAHSLPDGVIFAGSPGNGKTFVYKMVTDCLVNLYAGGKADRVGVCCTQANGSEFIYKYVGVGANRIKALYNAVRRKCREELKRKGFEVVIGIVCVDEIDSFTFQRAAHNHDTTHNSEQHHTLNMFLSLLDDPVDGDDNEDGKVKIFTIATTNLLEGVDSAVKRYGRFDEIAVLGDPSEGEREAILRNVGSWGEGEGGGGDLGDTVLKTKGFNRVEVARVARVRVDVEGEIRRISRRKLF
ncbi:hypothetical protein TrCOL_g4046 [Triparma columacea]|uniref:ATPase AAA-type core domain-containing protein n=1 Tax=Triparma columacea TaxID=722753 RepID=A0A9W7LAV8_9STRA|nr:hypothetical protein TrCOL_g4046 [Triparma columacea]